MADKATATKPTNAAQAAKAEVRGGLTPYLMVDGAIKASEFYKRAFGAEIASTVPPDDKGRTMHVHLYVHGQSLMLSDPFPEHGAPFKEHQGLLTGVCLVTAFRIEPHKEARGRIRLETARIRR